MSFAEKLKPSNIHQIITLLCPIFCYDSILQTQLKTIKPEHAKKQKELRTLSYD